MIVGELGPRPLCPRCKENTRASKATYCRPCGAEYMREQRLGKHSKERICENCSTSFKGKGANYFCPPCRKAYREKTCNSCHKAFLGSGGSKICKKCNRDRHTAWRKTEGGQKHKLSQRAKRFGVSVEFLVNLYNSQNAKCACCKDLFDPSILPHVDHDHSCCPDRQSCGKCVRGLLCKKCNLMLGYARDNADILNKGIKYLDSY